MKKACLTLVLALIATINAFTQVSTNGGSGLAKSYPNLNAAITDLNSAVINSPIVITLTGNETAPSGGYTIMAQGTASNTITVQGVSSTITASGAQVAGKFTDAIFKLVGADYVTLKGFALQENVANTITSEGTNNMTEWGIALLYATVTNGAQNCTIQGNTISLNKVYQNTFGIYSNATHSATVPGTTATATKATGSNSGLKVYSNLISNVNIGIAVVGPTAAADHDRNVDIGGTMASTGNTITNYGTTDAFSTYANVNESSFVSGVLIKNATSINISNNRITSSRSGSAGVTSGDLFGIFINEGANKPIGTYTNNINNNTISLTSHADWRSIIGIEINENTSTLASTTNINGNNFTDLTYSGGAASGSATGIRHSGSISAGPLITNINNNTFTNITSNTTGSVTLIYNAWAKPAYAITNVNENAIVGNFIKTGDGGRVCFYRSESSSPTTATEVNRGNNFSNVTVVGNTILDGWQNLDGDYVAPYGSSKTVIDNVFSNITAGFGEVNILYVGRSNANASNLIAGNIISNVTATGTIRGIYSFFSAQDITGNTISNIVSSGSYVTGIHAAAGTVYNINKNKLYNLSANGTLAVVKGIHVSDSITVNITNNLIGDLRAPASSSGEAIMGIYAVIATNINVRHNTVWLNATSSGSSFGTSAIVASPSATSELSNNIFVNTSTPKGSAFASAYRSWLSPGYTLTKVKSSNNLFYAGVPGPNNLIFTDGITNEQTLAGYKARVANNDTLSVTENPNFLSVIGTDANFLHINPAIPTQIESGGLGGTIDDFDGDVRHPIRPDIGADEFNGTYIDLGGPNVIYAPLAVSSCTTTVLAPVTITDTSGVNMITGTKPRLYYKKSTDANTFNDNTSTTNGWKYVEGMNTGGNTFSFTIDYTLLFNGSGAVLGDVIQYFVVAQDLATTPNVTLNNGIFATAPTSVALTVANFPVTGNINQFQFVNSLSGTVTVGTGGTFPTLTGTGGLFEAINNRGIATDITANIIAASITEPGTIALNAINYSGCAVGPFSVVIKPAAGVTATLTGTITSLAVIKLNGADYVTIDGSNSGGNDRNLIIQNLYPTPGANAGIWLASTAVGGGANHNTIKNCIIEGNAAKSTYTSIYVGSSSNIRYGSPIGFDRNSDNTIMNNLFRKSRYGVVLFGLRADLPDQNNVIANNTFGSATVSEALVETGLFADKQENLLVTGNEVQYIGTGSTVNVYGIRLTDFKRGACVKNKVHHIAYSGGNSTIKNYGIAVQSINYATAGNASNALIANNFIYNITSNANSSTWNETGLLASNGYADRYYHNTIHLNGQLSGSAQGMSAAFANGDPYTTGYCINIDVRNNIINLAGSTSGGNVWAYYTTAPSFNGAIQKNNLLRSAATGATNNIGYFNGVNYPTLAAWQLATRVDSNSVSIAPVFVLNTVANSDLHLTPGSNTLLDNLGTPVMNVPNDIDGDTRLLATPDVGADEFTAPPCTTAIGGTGSGNTTICAAFSGTITAANYSLGSGSTYQWVSASNAAGPWTAISGANNPISYTVSPPITTTTYYKLAVGCATNASLDSSSMITVTVVARPTIHITPTDTIICAPGSAVLRAHTNAIKPGFVWLKNNIVITGATSNSYTTNTSGSYRVRVLDSLTSCFDTSLAVAVTAMPQPVALSIKATPDTVCLGGNVNLATVIAAGYVMNPAGRETFINIEAALSATSLGSMPANSEYNISIPAFKFNGVTYTTARVGMNGGIALGASTGDIGNNNTALPTTANTTGGIQLLPFWDYFSSQSSPTIPGSIILDTVGSKFIIQYNKVNQILSSSSSTGSITFQIQLDTLSGQIHFVYDDVDFGDTLYDKGNNATVGIQWSTTNALQYSYNKPSLTAGQCITFTPTPMMYTWTGPNGFISSSPNPTLTNIAAADSGTYTVVFTNVVAGCSNTASVKVNVRTAATTEWIGIIDNDWNNAGNWVCGIRPTASSNVILRSGAPNYPIVNAIIDIRSLTVKVGAIVTVSPTGDLRIGQLATSDQ